MPTDVSTLSGNAGIHRRAISLSALARLLLISAALLVAALPVSAQNFGRILGTVSDPSGAAIAGAAVTIKDVQRDVIRTLTTDASGQYVAPSMLPGTYTVRAEAKGFNVVEHPSVVVEVGQDARVDITLPTGSVTQTVTVSAAVPLVDTTGATLGGTISNETINDLPLNGRNFQNLITLRPGVMIYPGGGAWTQSTNGLRAGATIYYVDGLMDNDYNVGWTVVNAPTPITEAGTILPIDSIQEFNLEQNPKAEFGWKPGGVVNVGVRSGTNELHGSAYAFGRDGSWDARNYFNPVGQPQLPLSLQNFGGTVGGPILKNRLFFFVGYEGRRDEIGNSSVNFVPQTVSANPVNTATSIVDAEAALNLAGVPISPVSQNLLKLYPPNTSPTSIQEIFGFPNHDTSDNGIAKVDWHINQHNTLSGMLFIGDYTGSGEDRPYVNQKFLSTIPLKAWVNNYAWIWTPNAYWVNEARFGFNRMTENLLNGDIGATSEAQYGLNTGITFPGGLPSIGINPFSTPFNALGTSLGRPAYNGPSPLYDWLDNVSWVHGKHSSKFGFELARISADVAGYALGRGSFNFLASGNIPVPVPCTPPLLVPTCPSTPLEDFLAGYPDGFNAIPPVVLQGNPTRHYRQWAYAGFFQDDWRISPRLTLNLGMRYEYFTPPSEAHNLIGNFCPNPSSNNVGVTSCPASGLEQVGVNISQIFKPVHTNFSPRIGVSWDPTGSGKTAIRAGGAVIYDHPFLGLFSFQVAAQDGPSTGIASIPTGFLLDGNPGPGTITTGTIAVPTGPNEWNNGPIFPTNTTPQCASFAPCGIMGVVPNYKWPYVANWNVGVQHSFTSTLALDVEYVGNHGGNQSTLTNINQPTPTPGTPVPPYSAQFDYLGFINMLSNIGHSNYNGLQLTLTQHTWHGLSYIAGYTYSHALDLTSLDAFALLPQDSQNPGKDYASSDFDIRHRFTLSLTYALPGKKSPLQLLEGWQINSIITLQSRQPWLVDDTTNNFSNTGDFTDRWDFFGNPSDFNSGPVGIPYCSGTFETPGAVTCVQYVFNAPPVNFSAAQAATAQAACLSKAPDITTLDKAGCYVKGKSLMVPPAFGTFGTMRRNIFRDSGFQTWDLSVFKNIRISERINAQFRAEFFNFLNHPNFANPYGGPNGFGATIGSWSPASPGAFGCGCATPDVASGNPIVGSGDARAIQLGLKILF